MDEEHDLEELEEATGRNARDAADLDAATAEAFLAAQETHPAATEPASPGDDEHR